MSNPFSKLAQTAKNTSRPAAAAASPAATTAEARRCPGCGAPRFSGSDLARCEYCGHRYMAVSVQVDARGAPKGQGE